MGADGFVEAARFWGGQFATAFAIQTDSVQKFSIDLASRR